MPNSVVDDTTGGKGGGSRLFMYFILTDVNSYVDHSTESTCCQISQVTSPEGPGRGKFVLYITFQKYSKIKFFMLRSQPAQCDLSRNALKPTNFQLVWPLDFSQKCAGNLSGPF
jgi:hypothetical protein